jgi:zinc/manganese transport system substrate-binding protein
MSSFFNSSFPWEPMERIRSNMTNPYETRAAFRGVLTVGGFMPTRLRALAALVLMIGAGTARAASKLNVVTATEDLAALAREVGGDHINVDSIAKGYQDPHFVEPKPSFLLRLQKADLLIVVGLQLEIGWLPPLQTQSRNSKIQVGANGYLDASQFAKILEIPTGQITRAMGDVHPLGNPHYWLDPDNGRRIAKGIADKMAEMQPADASYFQQRYADFDKRLAAAEKGWEAKMAPFRGRKIITYHRSWPNFCEHYGLDVVDYIEPRPGIPPTPSHTLEVINTMKRENIKLIFVEPYFDLRTPNSIASAVGGNVVQIMPSVGGVKEITNYFQLFDYDINLIANAFNKVK